MTLPHGTKRCNNVVCEQERKQQDKAPRVMVATNLIKDLERTSEFQEVFNTQSKNTCEEHRSLKPEIHHHNELKNRLTQLERQITKKLMVRIMTLKSSCRHCCKRKQTSVLLTLGQLRGFVTTHPIAKKRSKTVIENDPDGWHIQISSHSAHILPLQQFEKLDLHDHLEKTSAQMF